MEPFTCPPVRASNLDPQWLTGGAAGPWDLIYLDLHGQPGDAAWYGDDHIVALTEAQVRGVDLGGAVVFAVSCYLADDDSPMMDALLDAGARYVIGGTGPNYGGKSVIIGAPLLGLRFRQFYGLFHDPLRALWLAKRSVSIQGRVSNAIGQPTSVQADDDALEFRAFYRSGSKTMRSNTERGVT